jgi:hypothetical protein
MPSPKDPIKYELWRKHLSEASKRSDVKQRRSESSKIRWARPEEKQNHSKSQKLSSARPEVKQRRSISQKKRFEDPKERQRTSEMQKTKWQIPEYKTSQLNSFNTAEAKQRKSDSMIKRYNNVEERMRSSESSKIIWAIPEVRKRITDSIKIANARPEVKQRKSDSAKRRFNDPEERKRTSNCIKISYEDPYNRERHLIGANGQGFWYGHPILHPENNQKTYCELWNKSLWVRIDAAWDYKSAISGKTRWENYNNHQLSRHHVYWQEKACCVWDEDAQGYYANINTGTKAKPNIVKHYIKGDPNKFVLLTQGEHGMVKGNKKSEKDLMYWVHYFEDLIEKRESEGKPCYISKEDYPQYRKEHADTIAYYTQKPKKMGGTE